jgi:hypothetical protein
MDDTRAPLDEGDYRAASDRMLATLEKAREGEAAKRLVPIGSPEFVRLARDVKVIVSSLLSWCELQEQMAIASPGAVARGEARDEAIEAVSPRASQLILADWREAVSRAARATPGSPDAASAHRDAERFRSEYHDMANRRRAAHARSDGR